MLTIIVFIMAFVLCVSDAPEAELFLVNISIGQKTVRICVTVPVFLKMELTYVVKSDKFDFAPSAACGSSPGKFTNFFSSFFMPQADFFMR